VRDCFICSKHHDLAAVPGGEILGDEYALVSHLPLAIPSGISKSVYLGYVLVETRRHVAEFGDLSEAESASVGRLASQVSQALQRSEGAEHVYAAVIGHGVAHFHLHLIPRYPGTPREYWWTRVDEWPDAPRGDADAIDALALRLRAALAQRF
jgi:diadenosine tetraphosphate (Ap4A) HIT family hydrolase